MKGPKFWEDVAERLAYSKQQYEKYDKTVSHSIIKSFSYRSVDQCKNHYNNTLQMVANKFIPLLEQEIKTNNSNKGNYFGGKSGKDRKKWYERVVEKQKGTGKFAKINFLILFAFHKTIFEEPIDIPLYLMKSHVQYQSLNGNTKRRGTGSDSSKKPMTIDDEDAASGGMGG